MRRAQHNTNTVQEAVNDNDVEEAPFLREENMEREEVQEEINTREPNIPSGAPPLTKTRSEISVEDNLINSFVNGAKSREIEVVFAFDTTYSMVNHLEEVRKKLKETCTKLMTDIPNIKIGLMAIGDYDAKEYAECHQDLCSDTEKLVSWIEKVKASTSYNEWNEAYELALHEANSMSWSKRKDVNKALVIIGDSYPHPQSWTTKKIYWRDEVAELAKEGVKIYGVWCHTRDDSIKADIFYQDISEMTGGVYLTLKHFQLITDMFKAVCYREFGAEHLETFRAEVAERGAMDGGMNDMFTQLKEGAKEGTKVGTRSKEGWYLKQYDMGVAKMTYNESTGKWQEYFHELPPAKKRKTPAEAKPSKKVKTNDTETVEVKEKGKVEEKKEVGEKESPKSTKKKTPSSPKPKKKTSSSLASKKKTPKKSTKKNDSEGEEEIKKKDEDSDDDIYEKKKPLKRDGSVVVGTGEWKRNRHGRMVSLTD